MPWGLPFPSFSSRTDENNNVGAEDDPAPRQRRRPVPIQTNLPDDPARREERLRAAHEAEAHAKESRILATVARDRKLREQAPDRWQPDIDPNSGEFAAILNHFASRLRDQHDTLDNVLCEELAPHERALLTPVDRADNPALAAIQARNTALYSELLRSQRFRGWASHADLAFKLTLVFFGLPVAPMRMSSNQAWKGLAERSDWEDELLARGEDEGPSDGRLRFLNEYWIRMYEQDALRHPDPGLEAYYAYHRLRKVGPAERMMDEIQGPGHRVSLSLRGGGGDDDDDSSELGADTDSDVSMGDATDMHDADDAVDANDADLSLRGGQAKKANLSHGVLSQVQRVAPIKDRSQQKTPFPSENVKENAKGIWVPMHGFMGIVWFNVFSLYSYVDAVDRLLCLDNRAGITYNIYLFDRRKDYTSRHEQRKLLSGDPESGFAVTCAGVGDYSHDNLALTGILERLNKVIDSGEDLDQIVIFVAAPADPIPLVWEPTKKEHRVIKLTVEWPHAPVLNRLDVAYVRMPPEYKSSSHHYSNFFGLWMAQACRVLGVGRLKYRPGRPTVPDAFFAIKNGKDRSSSYGGLSFSSNMWQEIVTRWESDESQPITLVAETRVPDVKGLDEETDCWNIFVPGYNPRSREKPQQYLLWIERLGPTVIHERIRDLMKAALSDYAFEQLDVVEVYLPGDAFFTEDPGNPIHRVPMAFKKSEEAKVKKDQARLSESLEHWSNTLRGGDGVPEWFHGDDAFSSFITLRPLFKKNYFWGGRLLKMEWRPDETSLDDFYKLAIHACSAGERNLIKDSCLSISQGDKNTASRSAKPRFLITPLTTESEWRQITKEFVEPDVFVRWVKKEVHAPHEADIESTQPFGLRDTYEPPLELVYPERRGGGYPDVTHHKDWQLEREDVFEDLRTVQPWEDQPDIPEGPIGSEGCPVRHLDFSLPPGITANMAQVAGAESPSSSEAMDTPPTSEPRKPGSSSLPGSTARSANARQASVADDSDADNGAGDQGDAGESLDLPRKAALPVARRLFPKSDMEKAAQKRRYSYAHPLSVHTEGNIPIHAPPIERLLRPPTESLPVVTQAFLTPTEARQLQRDYFDMRSIVLRRSVQCNYAGCQAVFPASHPERMDRHLRDCHTSWGCNFCDELLYKQWPPEQKVQHYLDKHADYLKTLYRTSKKQRAGTNATPVSDSDSEPPNPFVTRIRMASAGVAHSAKPGSKTSSGGFIDASDINAAADSQTTYPHKTSSKATSAAAKVVPRPTSSGNATSGASTAPKNIATTDPGPRPRPHPRPRPVRIEDAGKSTPLPLTQNPVAPRPRPARSEDARKSITLPPTQKPAPTATFTPPKNKNKEIVVALPSGGGTTAPKPTTAPKLTTAQKPTTTQKPDPAPEPPTTSPLPGEALYPYCPRCQRNHKALHRPADRARHDKICNALSFNCSFCETCGAVTPPESSAVTAAHVHIPRAPPGPYCPYCGLRLRNLDDDPVYRAEHERECRPLSRVEEEASCAWCGGAVVIRGVAVEWGDHGDCEERAMRRLREDEEDQREWRREEERKRRREEEEGRKRRREERAEGDDNFEQRGEEGLDELAVALTGTRRRRDEDRDELATTPTTGRERRKTRVASSSSSGKRKAVDGGGSVTRSGGAAKRNKVAFTPGTGETRYFRRREPPSQWDST